MKKVVIGFSILITGLFAQGRLTAVLGINYSTIAYNKANLDNAGTVNPRGGVFLGVESHRLPVILGAAYAQYGADFTWTDSSASYEGSDNYNYLTGYAYYPFLKVGQISGFGGVQGGLSLGGKTEGNLLGQNFYGHIKAANFALDFGAIGGVTFTMSEKMGIGVTYYYGLVDARKFTEVDQNFKNRGFRVTFNLTP